MQLGQNPPADIPVAASKKKVRTDMSTLQDSRQEVGVWGSRRIVVRIHQGGRAVGADLDRVVRLAFRDENLRSAC